GIGRSPDRPGPAGAPGRGDGPLVRLGLVGQDGEFQTQPPGGGQETVDPRVVHLRRDQINAHAPPLPLKILGKPYLTRGDRSAASATERRYPMTGRSAVRVPDPVGAAEQAAEAIVQALTGVLDRVDAVDRRAVGGREMTGGVVIQGGADVDRGDDL